jgi:hypothetical protein
MIFRNNLRNEIQHNLQKELSAMLRGLESEAQASALKSKVVPVLN